MKMNVFEGARRTALALAALWVIGCVAYAVFVEPYASMTFAVTGPGERPSKADACGREDATRYISAHTPQGKTVGVTLCFTAHKANDGRMLVPYAIKTVNVRMPDGTIVENVPEGLSRADLMDRLKKSGYDVSKLEAPATSPNRRGPWEDFRRAPVTLPERQGKAPLWKEAPEVGPAAGGATTAQEEGEFRQRFEREQQLERELRNADAAGDTAAAQQLAAAIREQRRTRLLYLAMGERYSTEVSSYAEAFGAAFVLSAEDAKEAETRLWDARVRQWKDAVQVMLGALFIGWVVVAVVGWIARGFLGIPRGMDARPAEPTADM